jgi:glucan phosphorylase
MTDHDAAPEQARIAYFSMEVALNTPRPPHEASGTSGMKAAHNGVPSLSVLDGWWLEGFAEGITGWAIGPRTGSGIARTDAEDAGDLYESLETLILPLYHEPGTDGRGSCARPSRSTPPSSTRSGCSSSTS